MANSKMQGIFLAINSGNLQQARELSQGEGEGSGVGDLVKEKLEENGEQNQGSGIQENGSGDEEENGQGKQGEQPKQEQEKQSKAKSKDDKPKDEPEKENKKPRQSEYIKPQEYEEVKAYIKANEPIVLYGSAGTGKSTMVEQIAKELGMNFYSTNSVNDKFELTGFQDANGNYQSTQFYDFCVNGGIFCFDEIDASVPEAIVAFNTAIAQRFFVFPKVGRVDLHPNCRFVACANTIGDGATLTYVGRSPMDAASKDRFGWLKVDYNKKVEMLIAENDSDLVEFIDDVRHSAEINLPQLIVSYRAIARIVKLKKAGIPLHTLLKQALLNSIDKDDLPTLWGKMKPRDSEYYKAFKKLAGIRE